MFCSTSKYCVLTVYDILYCRIVHFCRETTEHFGPTAIPDFIPLPKSHKSSSKPCKRPGVVVTKIKKGVKVGFDMSGSGCCSL